MEVEIERDAEWTARRKERDEKLSKLLKDAEFLLSLTSTDNATKPALYRLRFDILLALYQDVGW